MNIIQLSEQLKDVPDNFLLTEVQNPTGSYPSYLVVAELTRRKRMRSSAAQEAPQTTVAEDLASPQPIQQPQQPAGLGALAQPGEMAAQDAGVAPPVGFGMPQEMPMGAPMGMEQPQMMAGGGLVAFRDGGDVIRAQSGLFVNPEYEAPMTFEEELQSYRPGRISRALFGPGGMGGGNIRYQLGQLGYTREQIDQMDPGMQRMIVAKAQIPEAAPAVPTVAAPTAAPTPEPTPEPTISAAPASPSYMSQIRQLIAGGTAPTATTDREAGLRALGEALPDTATPVMQRIIEEQKAGMEGRRGSNLNMALMQAGLGMMGSKGRGLQGVAEGGLEGLKAYREGEAEIRKGEQLMQASQLELAKAQDARSRGLFDLQLRSEQNAAQLAQQARTSQLQGAQIIATLQAANMRSDGRGVATVADRKSAVEQANVEIMRLIRDGKLKPGTPEEGIMRERLVQQILIGSGKSYTPLDTGIEPPQFDFNALMSQ